MKLWILVLLIGGPDGGQTPISVSEPILMSECEYRLRDLWKVPSPEMGDEERPVQRLDAVCVRAE